MGPAPTEFVTRAHAAHPGATEAAESGRSSGGQAAFIQGARSALRYALQPIVNIHTGGVLGYEALLRGVAEIGFQDVHNLFGHAWNLGFSAALDRTLRDLAIRSFAELPQASQYRLFFNLDPHLIEAEDPWHTLELLRQFGLRPENLCFELSERADFTANPRVEQVIGAYRRHRFHFAIDDFGSGYAGLRLLYEHPPDLLKIDRFFISGIAEDHRKRLFVANTVQLAHLMGIRVIAEGVETEPELLACREIGCDLAQGYLIAHPQLERGALRTRYEQVLEIHSRNQRAVPGDLGLIERFQEHIPPLHAEDGVTRMFDAFRHDKGHHVIPVLESGDHPLGLIHEADIKDFIYSAYGRELIVNRAFARRLTDFVRPCPMVDIHDPIDRLLEAYSATVNPAGVILTQDARYHSFISATSLLQLIEQKNLATARDQNPLTKLPGNNPIHQYVSRAISQNGSTWHLVYLDFDNFKAFNDHYGFRRGDRVILLFAGLLQQCLSPGSWFTGHIGGDDFFAGTRDTPLDSILTRLRALLEQFRSDVQSLYDQEDRIRGYLSAKDRYGVIRDMPLMRCSAAIIEIQPGDDYGDGEALGQAIAELKHLAKASDSGLVLGGRHSEQALRLDLLQPAASDDLGPDRMDAASRV
ncbi:bifunctional diguanylate cyclase/phosphodiesterase [Thiocystis violacea]|uniref:bifunctional diguanylate cyclase/phosphodiesterase n=1 Tax=Thiocystis violacea TaxID=13725 RepID=UPI0019064BAC|nr:bifunctional diguanylate cyclase/phosphodiesterase [Thiocystis violacea]MBK1724099.1 GGDEF domain-containing protein [Thiocystis violacea]